MRLSCIDLVREETGFCVFILNIIVVLKQAHLRRGTKIMTLPA